jgi:hypothetical protein
MSTPEPTLPSGDYTLVVYADGSEQLAPARVGDVVAFELQHDRPPNTSSIADVMWLVHRALDKPGESFQAWADTVAAVKSDAEDVADAKERGVSIPIEAVPTGES